MDNWRPKAEVETTLGVTAGKLWELRKRGMCVVRRRRAGSERGRPRLEVLIESLPRELQAKFWGVTAKGPRGQGGKRERGAAGRAGDTAGLAAALLRVPVNERDAWATELVRLSRVVERFLKTNPKRVRAGKNFVWSDEVLRLCDEARSRDEVVLAREPGRGRAPSPHTLEKWARRYCARGCRAFLHTGAAVKRGDDRRLAAISEPAREWVNANWRNYRSPRALYDALVKRAKQEEWVIPSESTIRRHWRSQPGPVMTMHLEGKKGYTAKHRPYVPRDNSDLEALEVLCGDHSERDLFVVWPDGTAGRPWLTAWQCLRTGLIWGWHLDQTPSSYTAGCAYADGVINFGAQPMPREDGFRSRLYTDQGKDYKAHHWDGTEIAVHKQAMKVNGSFELVLVDRSVGFCAEQEIDHVLARGYNAPEKPIERMFRDISDWEMNTFKEWCGRDTVSRPDRFREMWAQHAKFEKGKRSESPFIPFADYVDRLAAWFQGYNAKAHERSWLGGRKIVPLAEYERLYVERYGKIEISELALKSLLMRPAVREIGKNGVQMFQRTWRYWHPAMSEYKGKKDKDGNKVKVEVRYDPKDYRTVLVILPKGQIAEAKLITPTSLKNPNKQTLQDVSVARKHELKVIREHQFLAASVARGETAEDRVAAHLEVEQAEQEAIAVGQGPRGTVQRMTRFDAPRIAARGRVTVEAFARARVEADESGFELVERGSRSQGIGTAVMCRCGEAMAAHEFDGVSYGGCQASGCEGFKRG